MILVVAALPEELGGCFDGVPVVYTGVGKVNAACQLTRNLWSHQWGFPDLIVNFGTAACSQERVGTLVNCTQFYQWDMRCMELGLLPGATPFEEKPPRIISVPNILPDLPEAQLCRTGDWFVTESREIIHNEVHDMEAYALAKVCYLEKTPFACVKYISDSGDPKQWAENCAKAGPKFREIYDVLAKRYS